MAAEGGQIAPATVVVQYTKTERSQFHDFTGSYTPLVHSTGKGTGVVLRDGKAYKVAVVAPHRGGRHQVHAGRRLPDAVRPWPGLGRARLQDPDRAVDTSVRVRPVFRYEMDCRFGSQNAPNIEPIHLSPRVRYRRVQP